MKKMPPAPLGFTIVGFVVALALGFGLTVQRRAPGRGHAPAPADTVDTRLATSCLNCHTNIHAEWARSHHALAQRMVDLARDTKAFDPAQTVVFGSVTTQLRRAGADLEVETLGPNATYETYTPDMVIGETPLIQYLIPFAGGRWQTLSVSYDPISNEWFEVFGEEDRRPEEWGYWSNRGMNWNVQCAYCHMTNLKKGYNPVNDTYHTTWDEIAISCSQCHGPMEGHAEAAKAQDYKPDTSRTPAQAMEMCASCHSRREELSFGFELGDRYADHYRLSLATEPGLYYADGQILEEVYVYGSFMTSRMGNKDVTCANCHNLHSGQTLLPASDNMLCLQCHLPPGNRGAKPIEAEAHSFHSATNAGNHCVECHMPETTYMARDPRRDHGFIIPDPQLTLELGIPNACNRCHADKTTEWSVEWMEKWYGEKMDRPARRRTRAVARAKEHDASVAPELLELARGEDIPAWRAALISLLAEWVGNDDIRAFIRESIKHENPWVRSAAMRALQPLPEGREIARELLDDPIRQVRLDAAMTLIGELDPNSPVRNELQVYLDQTSDQPAGALRRTQVAMAENQLEDALQWAARAAEWEPNSAYLHNVYGQVLNRTGNNDDALVELKKATELEPENPDLHYSLALLYGELGQTREVVRSLSTAVNLDPRFVRAWYNLGLAHASLENLALATTSLQQAETLDPTHPDYPFALATIHVRQQDAARAREAAIRALTLDPRHAGARSLLSQIGPQTPNR